MNDLILLHGALGGSDQVAPLAAALAAHFTVHRIDFEGHASAPARERPYRVAHFVENVLDRLQREGIQQAHFFGYSMGGYVALCLALGHPERVGRIATLGTKFRWDPATAARESARLNPGTIRAKAPRFADGLAARHTSAGGWEAVLARTAEFLRNLGEQPVLTDETLSRIPHHVRVIVGDRDNTVSVDESNHAATRLSSGGLLVLTDTPHPIESVPVDVLTAVLLEAFGAGTTA